MFWYEILIVIAVLALDLGSKYGIVKALGIEHVAGGKFVQHNDDIEFIRNFISFSYDENTGATFGSFKGKTAALIAFTAVGLAILVFYLIFNKRKTKFSGRCLSLFLRAGSAIFTTASFSATSGILSFSTSGRTSRLSTWRTVF